MERCSHPAQLDFIETPVKLNPAAKSRVKELGDILKRERQSGLPYAPGTASFQTDQADGGR
jgi:hypothetical protein